MSNLLQQGLQYLLLFEALLLSAVVLYGALYWLLMPLRLHDKPIFFDYSNRSTGVSTYVLSFSICFPFFDLAAVSRLLLAVAYVFLVARRTTNHHLRRRLRLQQSNGSERYIMFRRFDLTVGITI